MSIQFEYFYGSQAEQFSFYRIPKVLFTDETLAGISVEAKVLYSFMLDRMSLSVKNCWFDEENRVYIIYTIDDILSDFGCARQKALKLLDELENGIGLIERKRQGLGRPNIIYVKNFIHNPKEKRYENQNTESMNIENQEVLNSNLQKYENHTSRDMKIAIQEVPKSYSNNTNNNYTDFNDNGTTDKNGMLILPAETHTAYIFGYDDGTFRPDNNMSRAEAAAIFARLISEKKGENISGKANFKDISTKDWFAKEVGYLAKYGIIKGYSDNTFKPNESVTRAEFVAMTVRFNALFNDVKKGSYTVKYTDVEKGYWAYSDIAYAKNVGWLNGYADGSFKGDNAITRAEVVTVVNKATGRIADEGYINKNLSLLNKFTDLKNNLHWAFYAIAEASNTHLANTHDNSETWVK